MLWTVGVLLAGVATALAWLVARERPDYHSVAALLTVGFISDLARQALRIAVFLPARERFAGAPYTGWTRIAADADNALVLAYPAAIVAVALWVFLRRRPWLVAVGWAVSVAALAVAYPATRGAVLSRCYLGAELVAIAVTVGAAVTWFWRREPPTLTHAVTLLIGASEAATLLPFRKGLFTSWTLAQAAYVTMYVILIVLQGGAVCGSSSSSKSS
jgi:hypothetical protein